MPIVRTERYLRDRPVGVVILRMLLIFGVNT